ncbi:MAG: alpha/beta fold hydrolase [Verrucomicrobiales bacterium]|nr:alpha/beta fold hydrolase [Verrucomicrobiales bacterium]
MVDSTACAQEEGSCAGGVQRSALYLESGAASLLAWVHTAAVASRNHAVLICSPVGHEQVHSHRSLRHLADRLAAEGYTVMRFDYHGTGDSAGTALDPDRCQTWLGNIQDAITWLRSEAGCRKVSLVGLRLGATLAALYASEHEVDGLVLWTPIVSGRRFVRELTALSRVAQQATNADAPFLEAVGFVYSRQTLDELGRIDLSKLHAKCRRVLIAHNDSVPKTSPLGESFHSQIDEVAYPGYEQMMAEPHETEVPQAALKGIADWLSMDGEVSDVASKTWILQTSANSLHETLHNISDAPKVFGVMTQPASQQAMAALPWIVILNSGSAHRIGPGRLHVTLARWLAELGYPCLRIDLSGLGDSVIDQSEWENDGYAATAFRDIAIVCDYLQKLDPGRPIVLMGLCSGAYAAFQSAAQLPHPALIESILLNPLVFFWREGMTIDDDTNERLSAWHRYGKAIFKWDNWRQLLSGKTTLGFTGSIRQFVQAVMPRKAEPAQQPAKQAKPAAAGGFGHPLRKDLPGDLGRIAAASRQLAMFISDNDPGYFMLMYQARRKAKQLMAVGQLRCFFIKDADHTFSTEASRHALMQSLAEYLADRFGGSAKMEEQ